MSVTGTLRENEEKVKKSPNIFPTCIDF